MPGRKFSLRPTAQRSKEGAPISFKTSEVKVLNRPEVHDLNNASILLTTVSPRPAPKEVLQAALSVDETIPSGHDCTRCAAAATGCTFLQLAENGGDNPIAKRIKAIQELKQQDPYFMERVSAEDRESLIQNQIKAFSQPDRMVNSENLNGGTLTKQEVIPPTPVPTLKIRYAETLPHQHEALPLTKQKTKTEEPRQDYTQAKVVEETKVKVPEQKQKIEAPLVQPHPSEKPEVAKEKLRVVDLNLSRELPHNMLERLRHKDPEKGVKKKKTTMAPPGERAEQRSSRPFELFKEKVNGFFSQKTNRESQEQPSTPLKRIFDRLIHGQQKPPRKAIAEPASKHQKMPDFSRPIKLGALSLLPISRVDRKFRPRRLTFSSFVSSIPEKRGVKPPKSIESAHKLGGIKEEGVEPEKIVFRSSEANSRRVLRTGSLTEMIKQIMINEKQIPFALAVIPLSQEASGVGSVNPQEQPPYKIIPVSEKTFFNLLALFSNTSRAIKSLSTTENLRFFKQILLVDDQGETPAPEEVKTILTNQVNHIKGILWYLSRMLLSINRINLYLAS